MCKIIQLAKASLQSSIIPSASYSIFEFGRNFDSIKKNIIENNIYKKYTNNKIPLLK